MAVSYLMLVIMMLFISPTKEAPTQSPHQSCSLSNLHDLEGIESMIFYSITWDCHLYAWRDGHAPKYSDVGLNGSETLMKHNDNTKADTLGAYVETRRGLTTRCNPDNGSIAFVDRHNQDVPVLCIMVQSHEKSNHYLLLKIDVEDLLKEKPYVYESLVGLFDDSATEVHIGNEKPHSCIFVNKDLHCYTAHEHDITQRIFKLALTSQKKTVYGEASKTVHPLETSREAENLVAGTWSGNNDSSVYVFDNFTDGWLYKMDSGETTANGKRKQILHQFPKTNGLLKSMWAVDQRTIMATKCSAFQCHYYWIQLLFQSRSPYTCLFSAPQNLIAGVLTDVRLPPVAAAQFQSLPEQQVLSAMFSLPDARNSYWPVILLVVVIMTIIVIIMIFGFIYESVGFKRRYLMRKIADERYAKMFWPDHAEAMDVTIDAGDNFPSYVERPPPSSNKEEPKKKPLAQTPMKKKKKKRLTEEDDKTPSSLKPTPKKKKKRLTEEEDITPPSLKSKPDKKMEKPKAELPTPSSLKSQPEKKSKSKSKAPGTPEKSKSQPQIRMSTHKPQALNKHHKKKRRSTHRRRRLPVPEPPPSLKSEKSRQKEKEDVLESIKVKPLNQQEPLASGEFTPATIRAKEKKEQKERRRKSISNQKSVKSSKK